MNVRCGFVEGGPERHATAILPAIEATVRADFAELLVHASFWKRVRLHLQMRREIRRRLAQVVSPKTLY